MTRIVNTGTSFPMFPDEPANSTQKTSQNPLDNKITQASTGRIDPRKSQILERRNSEQTINAKAESTQHNHVNKKIQDASAHPFQRTVGSHNLKALVDMPKVLGQTKHQMNELLQTELSYVKNLKLLISNQYVVEGSNKSHTLFGALHQNGAISKQEMIEAETAVKSLVRFTEDNIRQLRPAIAKINNANTPTELSKAVKEGIETLRDVFSKPKTAELTQKTYECMRQYRLWCDFSADQPEIQEQLSKISNKSAITMPGIFIQPIQRLPRIQLLLGEIVKSLSKITNGNRQSEFKDLEKDMRERTNNLLGEIQLLNKAQAIQEEGERRNRLRAIPKDS